MFAKLIFEITPIKKYKMNEVVEGEPAIGEPINFNDNGNEIEILNKSGKFAYVPEELIDTIRNFKYTESSVGTMMGEKERYLIEVVNESD